MKTYRTRRNRIGTNQYKTRRKSYWKRYLFVFGLGVLSVVCFAQYFKNIGAEKAYADTVIISPLPSNPILEEKIIEQPSEKELIIAYITKLWEKHGTEEVVHAINCFYSESGLRSNAYGENTNGTNDAGVAQINSIHKMSVAERMDWKKNLDKAYHIYTSWGNSWDAWYGKAC